ncbi:hypothetical protein QBC38DRAFT_240950 [Podospora fimiseda]|uniref:Uncharacterized protein n=1 Tax=Podospora fimiseda TaxID=252190 RepID=A0AAN7BMF2_9PEZI|nr:hypothetical protein QBC38DRAFT_240950 [Podospora fimiseda]
MSSTDSSPAEKQESLLKSFTRLSNQVYTQTPASFPPSGPSTSHPTTIVLYGWGDALPKHLTKYVVGFRALYPSSRIILIFGPILKALYQTLEARATTMIPVIEAIYGPGSYSNLTEAIKSHPIKENILLQVMSNTGGMNCAATMYAFHKATNGEQRLPYNLMICDSCPGSTDFASNVGRWSKAMAVGASSFLPFIPFIISQSIAAMFLASLHGFGWIIGATSAAEYSVGAVNNPTLSDNSSKRLYLYSKEDDIIHWEDIEAHAADARSKGWSVSAEMFEGTPHVGHMKTHSEKYWKAIDDAWREAVAKE